MEKLSLESLKERAKEVASDELLIEIAGGLLSSCHLEDFWIIGPKEGPVGDFFEPWIH